MNRQSLAIGATYFFLTASPGCWTPVLSNVLEAHGWGAWIVSAFLIKTMAVLVSPLAISAQADQRLPAEKIVAVLLTIGAIFQVLAFREVRVDGSPVRFLFWFAVQSLITAPTFALLNAITFAYLDGEVSRFGGLRVWGTIGWIVAGVAVSLLGYDASPAVGYLSAGAGVIAGGLCLTLPTALPPSAPATRWSERLGLTALGLLRSRDIGVVVIVACLFMMPLTAFYLHTPLFLNDLGTQRIAAVMSVGQITEVFALFGLGYLMRRVRLRTLMVCGFLFAIARYALFAATQSQWMLLLGIAFHGLCWSLFFEVSRAFLELRAPPEYRAQVQALMALGTSGLGSAVGTITLGMLYAAVVVAGPGWSAYWWLLTIWCAACGIGFVLVFRDRPVAGESTDSPGDES
ncbi:MAG: MFS transporter [Planctomycetota bacterium]